MKSYQRISRKGTDLASLAHLLNCRLPTKKKRNGWIILMEKEKHLYKKRKARGLLGTNQLNLTMEKIPFVSKGGQELQ